MTENQAIRHIRKALAYLYDDQGRIRIIASDIGLNISHIDISGKLETSWQGVIDEARKKHKLEQLIERAQEDYSENQELQRAWDLYKEAKQSKKITSRPTARRKNTFLSNFKIPQWKIPKNLQRRIWITVIGFIIFGTLYAIGSAQQCTVNVTKLNVRTGPGSNYTLVGSFSQGAKITPLYLAYDTDNQVWVSINVNDRKLWLPIKEIATDKNTINCPTTLTLPVDTSY